MKLKKYKLRKLCLPNQIGKYGIPAPAIAYSNGKIRYLRISDISEEGTLVNTDKKSVESDDIEQYILEENDIVFARTGNSTGRAYLYDKRDGVMAYAGFLIKYQLDEHKVNPIYLRYFTLSTFYKQWVANLSVGSTRGNISAQTFADCPIVLPPRHQQDVLVETLSNIDAKIKLNRQINDNLEAMAKQLYDYWFVQFDFPNEEGKPYKSSGGAMVWSEKLKREIPQGWIASNHSDLFTIGNGQTIPQNEGLIPAYGGNGIVKMVEISNYPACIIIGRVGANCGSIHYSKVPCWVSDNAISVCSKNDDWRPFLFYSLSLYNLSKNKGGSSQPLITHEALKHLYFPMSEKHINQFCHIVNELQDLIYSNQQEILKLTKQRDELLPLLMNGQATVNYHLSDD